MASLLFKRHYLKGGRSTRGHNIREHMESQWHIGWKQKGINVKNGEDKICSHWVYNGLLA